LGMDETIYGSLKGFIAMKRLAVPREHLVLTDAEFRNLSNKAKIEYSQTGITPTILFQQLPPNLEQLCIQVGKVFDWFSFSTRWQERSLTDYGKRLREWLLQIALHKLDNYPALRYVKIWKSVPDNDHEIPLLAIFGYEILSAYEEVGITL